MTTNRAQPVKPTINELIAIYEIENEASREAALNDYFLRVYEANHPEESEETQSVTIEVTTAEAVQIKPVKKHKTYAEVKASLDAKKAALKSATKSTASQANHVAVGTVAMVSELDKRHPSYSPYCDRASSHWLVFNGSKWVFEGQKMEKVA